VSGTLFEQYKAALRRGHLATIAGRLDEGLEAYREAARLVPDRSLPLASLGTVLHRLDRWPEAAEAFEQALQLTPDDEATLRARAGARDERGLRSGAASDLERLAFVLDVAGRSADAAEAAMRAADLEPSPARDALAARLAATAAQRGDGAGAGTSTRRPGLPPSLEPGESELDAEVAIDEDAPLGGQPHGAPGEVDEDGSPLLSRTAFDDLPYAPEGEEGAGEGASAGASAAMAAMAAIADDDTAEAAFPGITEERLQDAMAALDAPPAGDSGTGGEVGGDGEHQGNWPGIDLPSPPPPPLVGPPPEPEQLLAEADAALAAGDTAAARDLMLTAARVHREAGRLDAALEICLQLLGAAPGDPQVHLAIANLQLDRGWTGVATEKIELLVRLTSLTGDTQAEADVHGLASERLRDDPVPSATAR
jgi:tetratricopeptide (TPR) repeat protein